MTTFSQLVDDLVEETVRPDMLESIAGWVNQSIRDLHTRPVANSGEKALGLFGANRKEDELTANADDLYLWPIPSVQRFQAMEAIWNSSLGAYHAPTSPKVIKVISDRVENARSWYRTGEYIAITGVRDGHSLKVSWFEFPRRFIYKKLENRILTYDSNLDTYSPGGATEEQIQAETCWMLQRWQDAVKEQTRSKLYRRLADMERARMAYSAAEEQRIVLWMHEGIEGL